MITLPNLHLLFRPSICVIKLLDSSKDQNLLLIKLQIEKRFPTKTHFISTMNTTWWCCGFKM